MLPDELLQQAEKIIRLYEKKGLKLATAESCTGGLVAATLTSIAGSSAVLERGYVTYSNQAKVDDLDVPHALLAAHGAVSAEVAEAMASGARKKAGSDVAVSITGIAGPGGGTEGKPVGLVYLGISTASHSEAREFRFAGDRPSIRQQACTKALSWLLAAGKELVD